jgi:hypothetical protein
LGVDLVRFDEAGKLTDLVAMLRPASVVVVRGAKPSYSTVCDFGVQRLGGQ